MKKIALATALLLFTTGAGYAGQAPSARTLARTVIQ